MGLIGAWLGSLYFGMPLVVMPPLAFLTRPSRWLWALTTTAAPSRPLPTSPTSCACAKSPTRRSRARSQPWRMAFNGAEPVLPDTSNGSPRASHRYGLRREAIAPVYGLAEACVGLAFPPPGRGPIIDRVARDPLVRSGRAEPATGAETGSLRFVACGQPLPDHEIRSRGFHRQRARRAARRTDRVPWTFGHRRLLPQPAGDPSAVPRRVARHRRPRLRGRRRPVCHRPGQGPHHPRRAQHPPHELENVVGDIDGVRKGCVAVFPAADRATGTERLVVVAETRRERPRDARRTSRTRHERHRRPARHAPDDIVLAPPGTVLKTSSGKIRRAASRERLRTRRAARPSRPGLVAAGPVQLHRNRAESSPRSADRVRAGFRGHGAGSYWRSSAAPRWSLSPCSPAARGAGRSRGEQLAAWSASRARPSLCTEPSISNGPDRRWSSPTIPATSTESPSPPPFPVPPSSWSARCSPANRLLASCSGASAASSSSEPTASTPSPTPAGSKSIAAQDHTLVFFPEGRLSRRPGLRPFHLGAFVVAGPPDMPSSLSPSVARAPCFEPATASSAGAPFTSPSASRYPLTTQIGMQPSNSSVPLRDAILEHCGEPDLA